MLNRIHRKLGTAGFTIAIVALTVALGGTALAASGALSGKQKKEVEKIAKKFAGKPGAPGANGTNGTNGAAGKDGAAGTNGTNGVAGESVTVTPEGECTKFSNKSGSGKACNGTTGFTETLPSEETETGSWLYAGGKEGNVFAAVSFSIPLAAELGASAVHYVGSAGDGAECPGSAAHPEANPGNFCVYQVLAQGVVKVSSSSLAEANIGNASTLIGSGGFKLGTATSGALVLLEREGESEPSAYGTWAVTAP